MSQTEQCSKIKTPVVFFPGTLCDERVFLPCWKELDIAERAYSPLQWADNLDQMLALSQDRMGYYQQAVHLVGFSMGAYIASLSALQQPQNVASLTLIGFYSGGLSEEELRQRELLVQSIAMGRYRGMNTSRLKQFLHHKNINDQRIVETIKHMDQDLGANVLSAQMKATSARNELTQQLAKQAFPIKIVAGESDSIAGVDKLREMQQHIPGSELTIINDAGHMLPLEQPLKLAQYLQQKLA
jgi:pimeloyl-ACP methyl ester carboxylesterase